MADDGRSRYHQRRENKRSRVGREIQAMGLSAAERRSEARRRAKGLPSSRGRDRDSGDAGVVDTGSLLVSHIERSRISLLDPDSGIVEEVDLSGGSMPTSDRFAVGDLVELVYDGGRIVDVLRAERRSVLSRFRTDPSRRNGGEEQVLAANVDTVIIVVPVSSVKTRLIDRYLVLTEYGGIEPIICVNKIDRWVDRSAGEAKLEAVLAPYSNLGIPIVMVSAERGDNLHALRNLIESRTSVFSGQSGVGKSSLVNALCGEAIFPVQATRASDDRGRHTTSSSSVVALDSGTLLIDTPGIRQLENLLRDQPVLLRNYFREFQAVQDECRFTDCVHVPEPGCAVKGQVLRSLQNPAGSPLPQDSISPQRYESYLRLADPDAMLRRAAELSVRAGAANVLTPWVDLGAPVLERGADGIDPRGR